jgi:hypothetical protein
MALYRDPGDAGEARRRPGSQALAPAASELAGWLDAVERLGGAVAANG